VNYTRQNGREYFLNVTYKLKIAEPFLPKDYAIAGEQFALTNFIPPVLNRVDGGKIQVTQTSSKWTGKGNNFSITFDLEKGLMTQYQYKGKTIIENGGQVNFWRPMTDNDHGAGLNRRLRIWHDTGKTEPVKVTITEANGVYTITSERVLLNGDAQFTQQYTVDATGTVTIDNVFEKIQGEHPMMPKFGTCWVISKPYDRLTYYGRGPWENHIDRNSAAFVGLYQSTVNEQFFPYGRPQENGNKTEVRWLSLTDKNGTGIKIMGTVPLEFSALHYSIDDLDPEMERKQYHSGELERRNEVYLNVDYRQMGVAGIDSWSALPLEAYRINYDSYRYSFIIQPTE